MARYALADVLFRQASTDPAMLAATRSYSLVEHTDTAEARGLLELIAKRWHEITPSTGLGRPLEGTLNYTRDVHGNVLTIVSSARKWERFDDLHASALNRLASAKDNRVAAQGGSGATRRPRRLRCGGKYHWVRVLELGGTGKGL